MGIIGFCRLCASFLFLSVSWNEVSVHFWLRQLQMDRWILKRHPSSCQSAHIWLHLVVRPWGLISPWPNCHPCTWARASFSSGFSRRLQPQLRRQLAGCQGPEAVHFWLCYQIAPHQRSYPRAPGPPPHFQIKRNTVSYQPLMFYKAQIGFGNPFALRAPSNLAQESGGAATCSPGTRKRTFQFRIFFGGLSLTDTRQKDRRHWIEFWWYYVRRAQRIATHNATHREIVFHHQIWNKSKKEIFHEKTRVLDRVAIFGCCSSYRLCATAQRSPLCSAEKGWEEKKTPLLTGDRVLAVIETLTS